MGKKLIIIDGNSLLFRAYYATAYPGAAIMTTKDGIPTNAIFSFSNMINKILSSIKEDEAIFVAFDTDKKTFRHEQLETYKANRKPAPEDLVKQFPIARQFLNALNIYQFEQNGFEADDIAGTVAKKSAAKGYKVEIYTSDQDYLQLVDDNITINIIKRGLSDVVTMDEQNIELTYGLKPLQIIDYKGLRGDSSDNLPGIPGVGEKTATKLIQEHGDFEAIVEAMKNENSKIAQSIVENQDLGRLCRDLAIIKTDIELPFEVGDCVYQGYDFSAINKFCQRYELKQFMNRIPRQWKKIDPLNVPIEFEEVDSLKDIVKDVKSIGIACDFSDINYHTSQIYGLGFEIDGKNYYLPYESFLKDETAKNLLSNPEIEKFGYDLKAIRVALSKDNIEIKGSKFDLLIATYLLDSSLKNSFSSIMNFFGIDLVEKQVTLFDQNDSLKTCQMAFYSKQLYPKVRKELEKIESLALFEDLEMPLIGVLSDMEIEGFPLDIKTLDVFGDEFKSKLEALTAEIHKLAGEEFNIASPKQLGEVLFDKLALSPRSKKRSTSNEVLITLVEDHPIINKIIEYRKYAKLISTYVEGLKPHVRQDGKIHAEFNQALTTTGRLSSSNPNLQNISVKDEEGKMIRKAFFYQDGNYEILSLDYSQIELRVLSSLSNCKNMLEIFNKHEDIHASTAKLIFKLDREPTEQERRRAKTVNFGIVYGISDWGLAEELGIRPNDAKTLIVGFYEAFPEIGEFLRNIVSEAKENGYVSTLLGRRRYLRELNDPSYQVREFAKRAAMNAPIQGTAADLIKLAMVKIHKALKEGGFKTKIVLQIHDELIFKVPKEEKEIIYPLIKDLMEHSLDLKAGLEVTGSFAKDWYDTK